MFAEVTVLTQEQHVLAVPRAAVQQMADRTVVFVVRGPGRFEARNVTAGESSEDYVEVMAGLEEGDEIVTQGSYSLKAEALRDRMPVGGPQ
jgi:hypothetical protein